MNNRNEEAVVREAYEGLYTPAYDMKEAVARGMREGREGNGARIERVRRIRPRLLVAAALAVVMLSAVAAAGSQWLQWEVHRREDGPLPTAPIAAMQPTARDAFVDGVQPGEIRIAGQWVEGRLGESTYRYGQTPLVDEATLRAAVDAGSLPYTAGLPEGYRFIDGNVAYFLTPDTDLAEPTTLNENGDGTFFAAYALPSTHTRNVLLWMATYENDAGQRIVVGAQRERSAQSVSMFDATATATVSEPRVDGYERAMTIEDPDDLMPLRATFARKVGAVQQVELPDWVEWKAGASAEPYTSDLDVVTVTVGGDLTKAQAIAIAEAMR